VIRTTAIDGGLNRSTQHLPNLGIQVRRYAYGEDKTPEVLSGAEGGALGGNYWALELNAIPVCARTLRPVTILATAA